MNSYNTDIFLSSYYNLQSVHFGLKCLLHPPLQFKYMIFTLYIDLNIIANIEVQLYGSQLTPTFDKTVQSRFDLMPRLQFFGNAYAADLVI